MKCGNCGCSNPKGCAECTECGAEMSAKTVKGVAKKKAAAKKVSAKPKAKRIMAHRGLNGARASAR